MSGQIPSDHFVNEVADWLLATHDKRLDFSGPRPVITDLLFACADFCKYMAQVEEDGFHAKDWREHFSINAARKELKDP